MAATAATPKIALRLASRQPAKGSTMEDLNKKLLRAEFKKSELSAILAKKFEASKFFHIAAQDARHALHQAKLAKHAQHLQKLTRADDRRDELIHARSSKLAAAIAHCNKVAKQRWAKQQQQHLLLQTANESKAAAVETRRQDVHQLQQQKATLKNSARRRAVANALAQRLTKISRTRQMSVKQQEQAAERRSSLLSRQQEKVEGHSNRVEVLKDHHRLQEAARQQQGRKALISKLQHAQVNREMHLARLSKPTPSKAKTPKTPSNVTMFQGCQLLWDIDSRPLPPPLKQAPAQLLCRLQAPASPSKSSTQKHQGADDRRSAAQQERQQALSAHHAQVVARRAAAQEKYEELRRVASVKREAAERKHQQLQAERVAYYAQLGSRQQTVVTEVQQRRQSDAEELGRLIADRLNAAAGRREEMAKMRAARGARSIMTPSAALMVPAVS